jgi:hypothetical protein
MARLLVTRRDQLEILKSNTRPGVLRLREAVVDIPEPEFFVGTEPREDPAVTSDWPAHCVPFDRAPSPLGSCVCVFPFLWAVGGQYALGLSRSGTAPGDEVRDQLDGYGVAKQFCEQRPCNERSWRVPVSWWPL